MLRYYETEKGKQEVLKEKTAIKKSSHLAWEFNNASKNFMIWTVIVSALMILMISLYPVLHDYLVQLMSDPNFAQYAGQFNFSEINIANYIFNQSQKTWLFFGSIFTAIMGVQLISKEYKDGSAEFLYSLPIDRSKIVRNKFIVLLINTILFNLIVGVFTLIPAIIIDGFGAVNYWNYLLMIGGITAVQLLFGFIGFALGTINKKKINITLGLFVVFAMYVFYIVANITPDLAFFENFSLFTLLGSNLLVDGLSGYPYVLLIVWAAIGLLLLFFSFIKLKKDDVL